MTAATVLTFADSPPLTVEHTEYGELKLRQADKLILIPPFAVEDFKGAVDLVTAQHVPIEAADQRRGVFAMLKQADALLETAMGVMGSEPSDNPDEEAWFAMAEVLREDIKVVLP